MNLSCRNTHSLAHGLAEGQLGHARAARLRLHAARCTPCHQVLRGAGYVLGQLHQSAGRQLPDPPADLVHRIMAHLPEPSARQRLLIAVGGSAAAASAATVVLAAILRLMPRSNGESLLPGLSAGLAAVGAWMGRFAALFEVSGGLPMPGGGGFSMTTGPSMLPALLLIATGLMGLTAVLTLTATRPAQAVVSRSLPSS